MTADERTDLENEASRQLRASFGLRLSPQDFVDAVERVLPPEGSDLDDWEKWFTPFTETRPDLGAETNENRVLRLFVMTCGDAVRASGRTAALAIQKQIDGLPAEPRPDDYADAIDRVVSAVREKFTSGDIGGTDPRMSKLLAKLSLQWARARAREVLRHPPEDRANAAAELLPPDHRVGPGNRGEGRPEKFDARNFGIQVAKVFLALYFPRKRNTDWYRCIALLWIISGQYEFQEPHRSAAVRRAVSRPDIARQDALDHLINLASRLAAIRVGPWIRYHRGRDLPKAGR